MSVRFVRGEESGKLSVTYFYPDGTSIIYVGGTRPWRNQNPGNIKFGKTARELGAIGTAGGFAIFPDYETGRKAIFGLLSRQKYQRLTIELATRAYSPKEDKNDTERYIMLVRRFSGLDLNRRMPSLNAKELEKLVNAIERVEGWTEGKVVDGSETNRRRITKVRKNKKGTITAYYVEEYGWLTKVKGIALASAGKIDAVVATSRSGSTFLRSRPNHTSIDNLDEMG